MRVGLVFDFCGVLVLIFVGVFFYRLVKELFFIVMFIFFLLVVIFFVIVLLGILVVVEFFLEFFLLIIVVFFSVFFIFVFFWVVGVRDVDWGICGFELEGFKFVKCFEDVDIFIDEDGFVFCCLIIGLFFLVFFMISEYEIELNLYKKGIIVNCLNWDYILWYNWW